MWILQHKHLLCLCQVFLIQYFNMFINKLLIQSFLFIAILIKIFVKCCNITRKHYIFLTQEFINMILNISISEILGLR